MKIMHLFVLISSIAHLAYAQQEIMEIDLSGQWGFRIDSMDRGLSENWYETNLTDSIHLPGSMAENNKGNDVRLDTKWTGNMWNDSLWYTSDEAKKYRQPGNIKVPFWLTPVKKYYGPAWYQKMVNIRTSWAGRAINLQLERVHWESMVWVNGKKVGMQNTLATPHNYDLTNILSPGQHAITIRIDNRVKEINPGLDAHSISDNTQTNWNGIVGDIKLTTFPQVYIDKAILLPDVTHKKVRVKTSVKNLSGRVQKCHLELSVDYLGSDEQPLPHLTREIEVGKDGQFDIEYSMGENPHLWDEFNPHCYKMTIRLQSQLGLQVKEISFGLRDFQVDGKHFSINGRPVFLRGTLECAIFPLTGYPPTEVGEWKRILHKIKDYGLNHMRFHSWCPPEAAFQAADELGIYYQIEASAWATIGDGKPIDQWIYQEAESIVEEYGHHPSFVMMAYGNEPWGDNHKEYLTQFLKHMKNLDPNRPYTGGAGWPFLDQADFYNNAKPRIQGWGQELNSIINAEKPQTQFDYSALIQETPMPYVSHEMGQWCVFPNFQEMSKYQGVLKPRNFEIFKEDLAENHLGHLADSFLLASGKLQVLCYKADIEAALRSKDMAGFQLLDLHDFPGQGTALVGVLDAFWDEKGYVTGEEYRQFCDQTVPLARFEKRIFRNTENLEVPIEVAHYGKKTLINTTPEWKLRDVNHEIMAEGTFTETDIPIGNGLHLGTVNVDLQQIRSPKKLILTVKIRDHQNSWDIWVYPEEKDSGVTTDDFQVVQKLTTETMDYLRNGGKVLLNISKGDVRPEKGGKIGVGFSSIFWNTSWTKGQKPHTLGILCDPNHPALAEFPTEYHANWQWWDAMSHSNAIILDDFTPKLRPIVRLIDDWFENRRTALIFEAKVGNGKLLLSGIDLHTDLQNRPEAQQMLYSLKKYMASGHFHPTIELQEKEILELFVNK